MSPSTSIRLVNARVVDGTGTDPVEDAEVVALDGRLAYVGPRRSEPPAAHRDARCVDLGGRTVLPGFFDCHVHIAGQLHEDLHTQYAGSGSYATFKMAQRLRDTLDAGVTTVRDLGGLDHG